MSSPAPDAHGGIFINKINMKTVFTCPLPPTLNEQIDLARAHWSKSAKAKEYWTTLISQLARQQRLPLFTGNVWLAYQWQIKNFKRDPADNIVAASKYVMDGLVEAGILLDDSLLVIQSPIVHHYLKCKDDTLVLTISDRPIYSLVPLDTSESLVTGI